MTDFREFYTEGYSLPDRDEAERMGRWRALGARSKADHVVRLGAQAGLRPGSLAEIGCGDGALLAEPPRAGRRRRSTARALAARGGHRAGARGRAQGRGFDGLEVPVEDGAYDLAVLSHVLEHVPEPMTLLREAARVAPGRARRGPARGQPLGAAGREAAEAARIGHVQFFKRADVLALLRVAGLRVAAELSDPLPYAHHAFFASGRAASGSPRR